MLFLAFTFNRIANEKKSYILEVPQITKTLDEMEVARRSAEEALLVGRSQNFIIIIIMISIYLLARSQFFIVINVIFSDVLLVGRS